MKNKYLKLRLGVWKQITMVSILTCFITFSTSNIARAQQDCPLVDRIDNLMDANVTGGTTGFYLKRVNGNVIASSNANTIFEPASAIKVLFHAHAMRQVQVNNSFNLTTNILWERDLADDRPGARPRFPGFCTPANPDFEIDDLQVVLRGMMEQSDNRHTQAVRNTFTDNQIMNTANTLGLNNSDLNHNIGCVCNNQLYNETTLSDLGKIYEGVATGFLNAGSRQTFYNLMLTEINALGTAVRSIVDDENASIGLSAAQITSFKNQIELAYKGGSYGCSFGGGTSWRSNAGWASIPFKTSPNNTVNRQYVYGAFANAASNVGINMRTVSAELLRDEIKAALQTWAVQNLSISLKSSYQAGKVGTFIGNEFPLLTDVVDVVSLSSTKAVTAVRTESGKLKLIAFNITNSGSTITRKGSYTTAASINEVRAIKLSSSRLATAIRLTNGKLRVSVWNVNAAGSISHLNSWTAGNTNDFDILRLSANRFVTPVSTTNVDLKVIVWDVSNTGQISRKGDRTISSANLVAGDRLSSTRFVTAVRDVSFGNLKLQCWDVTGAGNLILRDTDAAGAVTDIDVTSVSSVRFVTSVQQGNLLHKSISWEVCSNGKIRRVDSGSVGVNIAEVSSARLSSRRLAVATRRWNTNNLDMSVWDIGTGTYLARSARRISEKVGQVKTSNLYYSAATQRYLTAYTNQAGNLKLVVWQVGAPQAGIVLGEVAGRNNTEVKPAESKTIASLGQNYPNPVQTFTNVPFELEEDGLVEIKLLNIQGQEVKTVVSEFRKKGKYTESVDLSNMPKGAYFYSMKTGNLSETKKMILN